MATPKRPRKAPRKPGTNDGPWEPSATHLEWYRKWSEELKNQAEIAREAKPAVSRAAVCLAVHKVGEWMRRMTYEKIMSHRDRQTAFLEKIARDAFAKFYETQSVRTVIQTRGGHADQTTTKIEDTTSNPTYLRVAMDALKAIREIWGVNAPVKSDVTTRHPEEIEGIPAQNSFSSRAEAYEAMATIMAERAAALRTTA